MIVPVFILAFIIYISFEKLDLYGISLAAVGMLGNLAAGLTIDAYEQHGRSRYKDGVLPHGRRGGRHRGWEIDLLKARGMHRRPLNLRGCVCGE